MFLLPEINGEVEQKKVEDFWAAHTGGRRIRIFCGIFSFDSNSSWLYIPDTQAINVTMCLSGRSPTQILVVTPSTACHLHNAYGHLYF